MLYNIMYFTEGPTEGPSAIFKRVENNTQFAPVDSQCYWLAISNGHKL